MMNRLCALLLVLISGTANGRSYHCVAEAGAYVVHGGGGPIKAGIADVSKHEYMLMQKSGRWMLKELGDDTVLFKRCESSHLCRDYKRHSGTFLRDEDGVFSITWFTMSDEKGQRYMYLNVAKGHCEKL